MFAFQKQVYEVGSCLNGQMRPVTKPSDKTYTAWQYSGILNKQALYSWCKDQCDLWDGCEGIMNFQGAYRESTANQGICHMYFGAESNSDASDKWNGVGKYSSDPPNELKPKLLEFPGGCPNGKVGCWNFYSNGPYPETPCELKK